MSIDMRSDEAEEKKSLDLAQIMSLTFVAVMLVLMARPTPVITPQIALYFPTCTGMFVESNIPKEIININIDFDDTLSWNGVIVNQAQFDKKLSAISINKINATLVLDINPLASYKASTDILQIMQKYQLDSFGLVQRVVS